MTMIENRLPGLALLGSSTSRQQPPLANPIGRVEIQALTVTDAWDDALVRRDSVR